MTTNDMIAAEKAKYDRIWRERPEYGATSPELNMLKLLPEELVTPQTADKKCLIVGSGHGHGHGFLMRHGFDCISTDLSDAVADRFAPGRFKQCAAHDMPFSNGEFELVVCCDVLEHIPEEFVDASLREIARVCAPSGRMVLQAHMAESVFELGLHVCVKPFEWWGEKFHALGDVLWTRREHPWEAAVVEKQRTLRGLAGTRSGRAFVLGSGPSLSRIDERVHEHTVLAINAAILYAPQADFFFTADIAGAVLHEYWGAVINGDFPVMVPKKNVGRVVYSPAVEGAPSNDRVITYERRAELGNWKITDTPPILLGFNSAHCAVHAARVLGCDEICLLGCDCTKVDGKDHCWQADGKAGGPMRGMEEAFERAKKTGAHPSYEVYMSGWWGVSRACIAADVDLRDASDGELRGIVSSIDYDDAFGEWPEIEGARK